MLAGKLAGGQAGGQPVIVEASPAPFTAYKQVAATTTAANGTYSVTVKPATTTRYRATAKTSPPQTSGEVTVGVRIRVGVLLSDATPRRGTSVVFSGRAYPAHDGALVSIQKRTSTGSYATVARTRLVGRRHQPLGYRRAVRVNRSGVYRVRASNNNDNDNDNDHLPGYSRARKINIAWPVSAQDAALRVDQREDRMTGVTPSRRLIVRHVVGGAGSAERGAGRADRGLVSAFRGVTGSLVAAVDQFPVRACEQVVAGFI